MINCGDPCCNCNHAEIYEWDDSRKPYPWRENVWNSSIWFESSEIWDPDGNGLLKLVREEFAAEAKKRNIEIDLSSDDYWDWYATKIIKE